HDCHSSCGHHTPPSRDTGSNRAVTVRSSLAKDLPPGRRSAHEPVEDVYEFGELARPFLVAPGRALGDAFADVEGQDGCTHAVHRCLRRSQLLQDLDTVPGLLDHAP